MFDRTGWVARARTVAYACIVFACGLAPSCSLIFDGSRFRGGMEPGVDAAIEDAGTAPDASSDASRRCENDSECADGEYCNEGACTPCDADGDGHPHGVDRCRDGGELADCDDGRADVYPGALPVCGNGVDESCGAGSFSGWSSIREAGFFPARTVRVEAAPAERIRVFAMPGNQALVVFQDSGRVPRMAVVSLSTGSADDYAARDVRDLFTGMGGSWPSGTIWYDAQRVRSSTDVRVAMLVQDGTGAIHVRSVRIAISAEDGETTAMDSPFEHGPDLDGNSSTTHRIIAHPALVQSPQDSEDFYFGVPTLLEFGGDSSYPEIYTLGVTNPHHDLSDSFGRYDPSWGSVSSGTDAAFEDRMTGSRVGIWHGSLDSSNPNEFTWFDVAGLVGRPAIVSVPGGDARWRRVGLVAASSSGAGLELFSFVQDCSLTDPPMNCMPAGDPTWHATFEVSFSSDPLLSAAALPNATALVLARGPGDAGSEKIYAFVFDPSAAMSAPSLTGPAPLPAAEPVQIHDLDVDAISRMSMGEHQVDVVYAYSSSGEPGVVYVAGTRLCMVP